MGKEEIAHNEQFLLFPQCFLLNQKIISPFVYIYDIISLFAAELEEPKIGISGKGLMTFYKKAFENMLGNGEIANNQHFFSADNHHFLCFPRCFFSLSET